MHIHSLELSCFKQTHTHTYVPQISHRSLKIVEDFRQCDGFSIVHSALRGEVHNSWSVCGGSGDQSLK